MKRFGVICCNTTMEESGRKICALRSGDRAPVEREALVLFIERSFPVIKIEACTAMPASTLNILSVLWAQRLKKVVGLRSCTAILCQVGKI